MNRMFIAINRFRFRLNLKLHDMIKCYIIGLKNRDIKLEKKSTFASLNNNQDQEIEIEIERSRLS